VSPAGVLLVHEGKVGGGGPGVAEHEIVAAQPLSLVDESEVNSKVKTPEGFEAVIVPGEVVPV
jgi:hypothetical protein